MYFLLSRSEFLQEGRGYTSNLFNLVINGGDVSAFLCLFTKKKDASKL